MNAQPKPIIVQPGAGRELHAFGNTLSVFLGGEPTNGTLAVTSELVPPGGAVYLPKGAAHCYRNVGATPARHWIITAPVGFETFWARSADEFAQAGGPDKDKIVAIHREHGIELLEAI